MNTARHRLAVAMVAAIGAVPVAHAVKVPNALATDNRIRQIAYDPNQIYELTAAYLRQLTVELAPDEVVRGWALGDTIAWQVHADGNRVFIKPTEPNAATNMTLVTTKRSYYFNLGSVHPDKARSLTFVVRIMQPQAAAGMVTVLPQQSQQQVRTAASTRNCSLVDPDRFNADYGWKGDRHAIPVQRVFDDGQFTCFRFQEGAQIPVIYAVEPDGTPSTVNARREGPYVVVERLAQQFVLRTGPNGQTTLCIINNRKS